MRTMLISYFVPFVPFVVSFFALVIWALSFVKGHSASQVFLQALLLQQFDELLDGPFIAAVGNERDIAILHDEQVVHAHGGDESARLRGDDAVARTDADMARKDSVAIGILGVMAFESLPAADVVPDERRLQNQYFRGMFHHRVVDADPLQTFIFSLENCQAVGSLPGVGDAAYR